MLEMTKNDPKECNHIRDGTNKAKFNCPHCGNRIMIIQPYPIRKLKELLDILQHCNLQCNECEWKETDPECYWNCKIKLKISCLLKI